MDLAKPGLIQLYCLPNALTTFKEYLEDYASAETKIAGEALIRAQLAEIPDDEIRRKTSHNLKEIESGKRDLYL